MDVKLVECKKIEFPKVSGELRSFNKEFATNLSQSIKAEGLHHPIVVRPNPAKEGCYLGVIGKHRWYAVSKILKEEYIDCNVIPDMDDTDAEMALISENLWRNPLKKDQHLKSIKRWWEHFAAKNPDKVGRGVAAAKAKTKKKEDARNGDGEQPEGTEVAEGAEGGGETANFAKMVSAATGASLSATKRDAKIAKTFSDDQIEALTQMKTSKADQEAIAKIKDKTKRDEIVNLIASGMEADDAIKDVMKDEVVARDNGKSKDAAEAAAAAKTEKAPELSDDEWFDTYCGEKARLLKDSAKFKADALTFRHLSDLRHAFRVKGKKILAGQKKGGVMAGYYYLFKRFISVSHPKDWFLCDECKGQGDIPAKGCKCNKCSGSGFLLKTEDFI